MLVAGRLESEPDLALSSPKCLVLLRIWAYFPRQVFERLTIGGLTLAQAEASAAVLQSAAKSAGTFVEGLQPRPSGRRCTTRDASTNVSVRPPPPSDRWRCSDDPELAATSIRYVPQPVRGRLMAMLGAIDLRLVASGHLHQRRDFTCRKARHIWAPSTGFIVPDAKQEVIGVKEVGLVEYRFQPDGFEVLHVKAPGQIDLDPGRLDLDLYSIPDAAAAPDAQ